MNMKVVSSEVAIAIINLDTSTLVTCANNTSESTIFNRCEPLGINLDFNS